MRVFVLFILSTLMIDGVLAQARIGLFYQDSTCRVNIQSIDTVVAKGSRCSLLLEITNLRSEEIFVVSDFSSEWNQYESDSNVVEFHKVFEPRLEYSFPRFRSIGANHKDTTTIVLRTKELKSFSKRFVALVDIGFSLFLYSDFLRRCSLESRLSPTLSEYAEVYKNYRGVRLRYLPIRISDE